MPKYMLFLFTGVVGVVSYGLSIYSLDRLHALIFVSIAPYQVGALEFLTHSVTAKCSALVVVSYFLIGYLLPTKPFRWLGWLSGMWMGLLTLTLIYGGLSHLLTLVVTTWWGQEAAMITKYLSWCALIMIAGGFLLGTLRAISPPLLRHVKVPLAKIDSGSSLDGFTILQLSDVHLGQTIGERLLTHLEEVCASVSPDLIVMTGDLVDGLPRYLGGEVKRFLKMGDHARHGMYLITGNHEYISGGADWAAFILGAGGSLLENRHVTLEHDGAILNLVGVEDWEASRFDLERAPDLKRALHQVATQYPTVLLAHQPKAAPEASQYEVDLQLSGHTHGGQIFPFNYFVYLDQPYNRGLYEVGRLKLYVNEGTGYWGPPLRLGTHSEVTVITLVAG